MGPDARKQLIRCVLLNVLQPVVACTCWYIPETDSIGTSRYLFMEISTKTPCMYPLFTATLLVSGQVEPYVRK